MSSNFLEGLHRFVWLVGGCKASSTYKGLVGKAVVRNLQIPGCVKGLGSYVPEADKPSNLTWEFGGCGW